MTNTSASPRPEQLRRLREILRGCLSADGEGAYTYVDGVDEAAEAAWDYVAAELSRSAR